jgi:hypothetical protein
MMAMLRNGQSAYCSASFTEDRSKPAHLALTDRQRATRILAVFWQFAEALA